MVYIPKSMVSKYFIATKIKETNTRPKQSFSSINPFYHSHSRFGEPWDGSGGQCVPYCNNYCGGQTAREP